MNQFEPATTLRKVRQSEASNMGQWLAAFYLATDPMPEAFLKNRNDQVCIPGLAVEAWPLEEMDRT